MTKQSLFPGAGFVFGNAGLKLFFHVADHLVDNKPAAFYSVKRQELVVVEIVHFDMYFSYSNRVDYIYRNDTAFKRLTGVFRALALLYTIEVLAQCFGVGLAFYIAKQQRAFMIDFAEQAGIAFIDAFKIIVFSTAVIAALDCWVVSILFDCCAFNAGVVHSKKAVSRIVFTVYFLPAVMPCSRNTDTCSPA